LAFICGLLVLTLRSPSALADEPAASTQVAVSAAVRGIRVVVVVSPDGHIDQVWTNTSDSDVAVLFRQESPAGPEVLANSQQLDEYRGWVFVASSPDTDGHSTCIEVRCYVDKRKERTLALRA
jgi:hypothetical protein